MRRPVPLSFSTVRAAAFAISASALLVACQVKGDVVGQFTCVDDPACPDGMSCMVGVCVEPGEQAKDCGTINQIGTTFDGNTLPWWADTYFQAGGAATVSGGDLVMTIPANMTKSRAQVSTYALFAMRGKGLEFEVPQVGGVTTEVGLFDPSGAEVFFGMTGNEMFVHSKGRFINGSKQPYSAVKHRWWRMRLDGSTAIWETSADRATWDAWATDPAPLDFGWVRVELSLQGAETNQAAATARWSSINASVDNTISWCPMSTWIESTTDNILAPHSDTYGNDCVVKESDGVLMVSATKRSAYCVVYSNRPIDARDSTYAFPVQAAAEPGWTRIAMADKADRNIVSMYADNQLHFYIEVNDKQLIDKPEDFNPLVEKFWRIVLQGVNVSFETSPDGNAWTSKLLISAPGLDLSAMFMERTVFTDESGANNFPTTATFGARIR
jgi:hypothetical protein